MALEFALCPYRLLFKHPFGTAHGLRDGTDSLFLRLSQDGLHGYGEVTLPPYLTETTAVAQRAIEAVAHLHDTWDGLHQALANGALDHLPKGARAAIQMACIDLVGKINQLAAVQVLDVSLVEKCVAVMTLGISPLDQVAQKLAELPASGGLKVKVGDAEAEHRLRLIAELDARPLLIDGNQGLRTLEEAEHLIMAVGPERVLAMEQPFAVGAEQLSRKLMERTSVPVLGDESIQNETDQEAHEGDFSGVNLKLMKCGGLDVAQRMAARARGEGRMVMLGSMSESSLGCTAMAQLSGLADILDLDGPWLLKNDPFKGLELRHGRLVRPGGPGLGVEPVCDLEFTPITI